MGVNKGVLVLSLSLCLVASYIDATEPGYSPKSSPKLVFIRNERYYYVVNRDRKNMRPEKDRLEAEIRELIAKNPDDKDLDKTLIEARGILSKEFATWSVSYLEYDDARKQDWRTVKAFADTRKGYTPVEIAEEEEIDTIRTKMANLARYPELNREMDMQQYEKHKTELKSILRRLVGEEITNNEPVTAKALRQLVTLKQSAREARELFTERDAILERRIGHISTVEPIVKGDEIFNEVIIKELENDKIKLEGMDKNFDKAASSAALVRTVTEAIRLIEECDVRINGLKNAREVDRTIIANAHFTILGHSTSYIGQLDMCRTTLNSMFEDGLNKVNVHLPFRNPAAIRCGRSQVRELQNGFNKWVHWLAYAYRLKRNPPKQEGFTAALLESARDKIYSMAGGKLVEDPQIEADEGISVEDEKNKETNLDNLSNWLGEKKTLEIIGFDKFEDRPEDAIIPALEPFRKKLKYVKNVPKNLVVQLERQRKEYDDADNEKKKVLIRGIVKTVWETGNALERAREKLKLLCEEKIIKPVRVILQEQITRHVKVINEYLTCRGKNLEDDNELETPVGYEPLF